MLKKRLILCGFGKVAKAFATLIAERDRELGDRYGLNFELAAVVGTGGAAISKQAPLPLAELLSHVEAGGMVETLPGYGVPGISGAEVIAKLEADVVLETTPTNLKDGQPGWEYTLAALNRGRDIVFANKGPLVLHYREIQELARARGARIMMSAATAAALPTLDVGLICLAGSRITSVEGILNGTTNYILTRMHKDKSTYETALREAQKQGIAETDPSLDVEGWDTRNKLYLIGSRIFERDIALQNIRVTGINGILPEVIAKASARGKVIKLLGSACLENGMLTLTVEPRALDPDHPLAAVNYSEKAICYETDTMGRVMVMGGKSSPVGAAAAMVKDLIHLSLLPAL
ncbi:MAG: homoserine dehydrogenase [Smithellaceae bacterium]|nr:homoserine dehydrogenase [Smithellaceae bacterium]